MADNKTRAPWCPNGHGVLERVPHAWSLKGWDEQMFYQKGGPALPNGKHYLVRIFKCPECGLVQLYEPDAT